MGWSLLACDPEEGLAPTVERTGDRVVMRHTGL